MNVIGSLKSVLSSGFTSQEPVLIDLGSSNTRIYHNEKKVFDEPTCLAVHTSSQSVVAVGMKALKLLGKAPKSVKISFPIQHGAVAHTRYLEFFLSSVIGSILPDKAISKYLFGVSARIAVPASVSPAKKALLKQILKNAGFVNIQFVHSGFAVAKNCIAQDSDLKDICVVDLGAQKTEVSVFSLGELVHSELYGWGGIDLTETLQRVVRTKHHCVVGWHVAEAAKKQVGSLVASQEKLAIQGKDLVSQASKTVILDASDLKGEFTKELDELLDRIQQFIALLPSEIAVSVLSKGIYITGGTSQLQGIDQLFMKRFKCDVLVSSNPELDVAIGLGTRI